MLSYIHVSGNIIVV